MRRLVLIGAILVGLALAAVALVVANLQRIVDANRERIVAEMSAGFGRPVEVGRVTVGLRGGVGVRLEQLRIADDPAFSKDPFVVADAVHAMVRVWPLLEGRVEVRRVNVDAPHITLIRTPEGLNVDSLGRRAATPKDPSPGAGGAGGGASGVPAIAVGLLNIRDGVVRFVDRSGAAPVEHTIAPLHLALSDVGQTTPVRVELEATLQGEPATRVRLTGEVGPVGEPPFARDVPVETHLAVHGPLLEVADLLTTGTVRRDDAGRPVASVRVRAAALEANGVALGNLELDASEQERVATIERLAVQLFGGAVEGHGRIDYRSGAPTVALEGTAKGLAVEQLLAAGGSPAAARVRGRLDANGSVAATAGDARVVRQTFTADGHAEIRNGTIRELNLADGVLTGVTGMGGLVTLVPPRIRDRYPDIFATDDTRFTQLSADAQIASARIHMDPFVVSAEDYTIRGKGVVTFDQHVDATATLSASERLTRDIIGAFKEASLITDDAGRIAIPFRVTGTMPNVRPRPDEEFVGRVVRKVFTADSVEHLLGGGGDGKSGDKKGSTVDRLKRGLDKLFR
ncbi:MAG TPA: AsmA-like C-terminal region-containing protein [Candidatus Eisenbacteria bacterium]|nr:AsmA-like C-terminal region-containing protein [Candidatus Eisenbacteria bacterium]